jgi:hypothetical protein
MKILLLGKGFPLGILLPEKLSLLKLRIKMANEEGAAGSSLSRMDYYSFLNVFVINIC